MPKNIAKSWDWSSSRRQTAAYIADLVAELEIMARREEFDGLAYLLRLARRTARRLAQLR